jgi:membrane protein insertase Oxa1/YidC/SpoIIIJ
MRSGTTPPDDADDAETPTAPPRRRKTDREAEAISDGALPAWLRAAVLLGVPSVIALFLVYMLTTTVALRIATIEASLATLLQRITTMEQQRDEQHERLQDDMQQVQQALRALCVAVARREEDRGRCYQ